MTLRFPDTQISFDYSWLFVHQVEKLSFDKKKLDTCTSERQEALVEGLLLAQQFADIHRDVLARLTKTELLLRDVDSEKAKVSHVVQKEKLQNIEDNLKQLQSLIVSLRQTGVLTFERRIKQENGLV